MSTKPILVLVHGYLGGSAQWANEVKFFCDNFQVVAPDLKGFGLNHCQTAPKTIGTFADGILHTLSNLGIERFHLLGHSMGGMIVQEMAVKAAHRIDKLILYSTGSIGILPGRFETIAQSKERIFKEGTSAMGKRTAATWFVDMDRAKGYTVCAKLADMASQQAAIAGLDAMSTWSSRDMLNDIKSPTLVLWGDCDRTYTWKQTEILWQNIPNASLAVVAGCAHAVHLEKPAIFHAVLSDFLLPRFNFEVQRT